MRSIGQRVSKLHLETHMDKQTDRQACVKSLLVPAFAKDNYADCHNIKATLW